MFSSVQIVLGYHKRLAQGRQRNTTDSYEGGVMRSIGASNVVAWALAVLAVPTRKIASRIRGRLIHTTGIRLGRRACPALPQPSFGVDADHRESPAVAGKRSREDRTSTAIALVALLILAPSVAVAVTEDNFRLRNGGDLVELCAVGDTDALRIAAIHMCHGFGAGTYQTIQALTGRQKLPRLICPPDPPPTRNEAVAAFVAWARQNSQYLGEPPVDLIGRFLMVRYPCPADK
jgi:Rap1a immunity proteins